MNSIKDSKNTFILFFYYKRLYFIIIKFIVNIIKIKYNDKYGYFIIRILYYLNQYIAYGLVYVIQYNNLILADLLI